VNSSLLAPPDPERWAALLDSLSAQDPEEVRIPISQYVWILKRHRWRILGFCAAAVIATVIISARLTPIYESTTTVDVDRESPSGVVGHRTPTQFAFRNQTMLSDAEVLQHLHFERTAPELEAASKKTIEIMRVSPYQKTANAGLFLKALASRRGVLPRLLAANLGNQLADAEALTRLAEFTSSAPELQESQLEQIAALPLGSRIKLDPWRDQITLVKTRPLEPWSPREKMPFEITPFILYLTRLP
jgi:hypothetical protein